VLANSVCTLDAQIKGHPTYMMIYILDLVVALAMLAVYWFFSTKSASQHSSNDETLCLILIPDSVSSLCISQSAVLLACEWFWDLQ